MPDEYVEFKKDVDFHASVMRSYLETKQELDKALEKLIVPYLGNDKIKVLDACCGIGHLSYLFSKVNPNAVFLGIDQSPELINEAKRINKERKNVSMETGDIYDFTVKHPKEFDITINWKMASWIPHYNRLMESLVSTTKKHIFMSSLFYDDDIDFEVKVREYVKEGGKKGFNAYYNVYSLPRFKDFVYGLGAKNIEAYDFEIGIDVPKPPKGHMGTYTRRLENGKRIQISGAILMLWKIIRIDLR